MEAGASETSTASPTSQNARIGQSATPPPPLGAQSEDTEEPGVRAQPTSTPAKLHQAQSRVTRALHAAQGMKLMTDLNARANTADQQRACMRFAGARGMGATAWATCQGVGPWERVAIDLYREILTRTLGSHDRDVAFDTRCYDGCDTTPSLILSLTYTRGGMKIHKH